jgi:hypothetical protein
MPVRRVLLLIVRNVMRQHAMLALIAFISMEIKLVLRVLFHILAVFHALQMHAVDATRHKIGS